MEIIIAVAESRLVLIIVNEFLEFGEMLRKIISEKIADRSFFLVDQTLSIIEVMFH